MMAGKVCKKSWTCPSDRKLRLRASLNYGWSFNTDNLFRKVEKIPQHELEMIENVLRRAKEIERMEADRIGKMLCKLESMTRNAIGDGERTCSMCGIAFKFFRSTLIHCVECEKGVCDKCRVETLPSAEVSMLCKICSESIEVWKKSGGWFYGQFPTMSEECQKECIAQIAASPGAVRDTWEHRTKDIVRLQSFEPPEENHNDNSLYKDWSMNSALDAKALNDSDTDDADGTSQIELTTLPKSQQQRGQPDGTENAVPKVETMVYESNEDAVKSDDNENFTDAKLTPVQEKHASKVKVISNDDESSSTIIPEQKHNQDEIKSDSDESRLCAGLTPTIKSYQKKVKSDGDEDEGSSGTEQPLVRQSYQDKSATNSLIVESSKLSASCPSLNELQGASKLTRKTSRKKKISTSAKKVFKKITNKFHNA